MEEDEIKKIEEKRREKIKTKYRKKIRQKFQRKKKIILTIVALLFLLGLLGRSYFLTQKSGELLVSFIDCGQADCIFIRATQGQQIIIDFGDNKGLRDLDKRINWWNKNIDLVIITHPHDDHIAGLSNLIKKYKVKNIMYTGIIDQAPMYTELLELIAQKKIPLLIPQKNQHISLGNNCQLNILYPFDNLNNKEIANLNNSSIVSRLDCLNSTFLFTGDIESEVENEILEKDINIKSDVLKIAHHGSITSSQEEFLEKVAPQIAIIMVGENNKFNHPSLRVLKRLERLKTKIFRNDLDGTIDILNQGQGLKIKTY